jgi:hypothetical protein
MPYLGTVELKESDIRRIDITSSTSATHTLTWTAPSEQSLIVTINGVKQQNNYTVSGTTLTLDAALSSSDLLEVIGINDVGTTVTPAQGSVDTDQLANVAVTTAKLAADSVTSAKIVDGAVANADMADMAANTIKVRDANSSGAPSDKALATTEILIGDGTGFTAASLSSDVTMTNAGAVTIADNAVSLAKLADGTQGDILYYGASGAPALLGFGTSGDFLKTQGTGANPAWATISAEDNAPSFSAKLTETQTVTTATWTKVLYNSVDWDTATGYDNTTNYRYTVPAGEGGKYYVTWGHSFSSLTSGQFTETFLYINGAEFSWGGGGQNWGGSDHNMERIGNIAVELSAADYIEAFVVQNSGSDRDLSQSRTFFQAFKLAGV